ncbi:flagellar hook capping FlgD N-terminal domain-containing protein [Celeribacter ethanolicus]|uniref:flagellar hook capping FlgD N-terminal domain-containing protein n=1 Tax=Celeribacter ethanolicus TaxID=1758178 RepID=UPI0008331BC3|nr:flagellar hook capping FlgD N-terminal domain-containing protein [Celeribacter ethanolicus]
MVNTITAATTGTTGASSSSSSSEAGSALSSDFDTFLKMLTVQMQNQDPLNPIESSDYAVQLATFSQVEQSVITNDLLEGLSAQLGLMGFSELSGWVGMDARSEAAAYFDGASPVTLTGEFATAADTGVLIVRDADGAVVQKLTMVPTDHAFEWSGHDGNGDAFEAGLYSFEIENYHNGDYLSTTMVEGYSRIVEARSDDGDVVLVLAGGNEIGSDDVTALRDPS